MNLLYPASYSAIGLIDSPHRLMLTASLAIGTLSAPIVLPVAEISPEMDGLAGSRPIVQGPLVEGGFCLTGRPARVDSGGGL